MRKFTLAIAAIILSSITYAQDVNVFKCDFNDTSSYNDFKYYDFGGDDTTWNNYVEVGTNGTIAMAYEATTDTADEYAISKEFELTKDIDYELSFNFQEYSDNATEKLRIYIYSVNKDSANKYRAIIYENALISNTEFKKDIASFTVPITQKYQLIFNCYSDPNQGVLIVDDISLDYFVSGIANTKETKAAIYPNPTTGILNIANAEGATVEIKDLLGNVVATKKMETVSKGVIDLSTLTNGIYMAQITKGGKTITRKINLIK